MSTSQDSTGRSWQRLQYLPRTVGLLMAADAKGTTLLAVVSAGMGLFVVADVHVLRRLIETAEQVVAGNAPLSAGLIWGLVLALLALLQAAVSYGKQVLDRHHQEVLGMYVEERCLQQAQAMPWSGSSRTSTMTFCIVCGVERSDVWAKPCLSFRQVCQMW